MTKDELIVALNKNPLVSGDDAPLMYTVSGNGDQVVISCVVSVAFNGKIIEDEKSLVEHALMPAFIAIRHMLAKRILTKMSGPSDFQSELASLINRHSMENGCNTPDFILASFLKAQLEIFDATVVARSKWYGCTVKPGVKCERP